MKKIIITSSAVLLAFTLISGIALAQNTTAPTATTGNQAATLSCVASAVAKRESAIQAGFTALSSSWNLALTTRASDLAAAWAMTDKTARNTAIKDAWKKFTASKKAARKAYNDARKASWSQFSTDRKACKASNTGENSGGDAL